MKNPRPLVSHAPIVFLILLVMIPVSSAESGKEGENGKIPYGVINERIAETSYSTDEFFKFDLSWTGGIKIGEMELSLKPTESCEDCFEIHSLIASTGGLVHKLYPVEDRHVTHVSGKKKLPFFCEIWQKQGRSYKAHKKISFDQKKFILTKEKVGAYSKTYTLDGVVHNEFSSFFSSRVMDFGKDTPFIVPTFGDDHRNEVVVKTLDVEKLKKTILGKVETVKVSPILTFSGLYDKKGDTVIWYTNDECRIPVKVVSKIVIGSITADLVDYSSPLCTRYRKK